MSASTTSALLAGCRGGSTANYVPAALDSEQYALAARLAEIIIPTTDTPGAVAAGVPEFMDRLLGGWASDAEQGTFRVGLDRLREAQGPSLEDAALSAALIELEADAQANPDRDPDFFRLLKEWTLVGYYTSEIGATQELRYETSPGRYAGCIPFTEVGRTWA